MWFKIRWTCYAIALSATATVETYILSDGKAELAHPSFGARLSDGYGDRHALRHEIPVASHIIKRGRPNQQPGELQLPHPDNITFERMRWAGHLTHKAYVIGDCATPAGTERVQKVTGSATGFITVDHPSRWIAIVMRGSVAPKDFIEDIQSIPRPFDLSGTCPSCRLHQGFQYAVNGVYPGIAETVARLNVKYPGYKIAVMGHSLGGSECSIIAGLLVQQYGSQKVNAYCLGSPRAGDAVWARSIEAAFPPGTFFRITSTNDGAPRVPPAKFGFRHIAREAWIARHPPQGPEDVYFCEGPDDMRCNAGKGGFLANAAHFQYFETYGLTNCSDADPRIYGDGVGV